MDHEKRQADDSQQAVKGLTAERGLGAALLGIALDGTPAQVEGVDPRLILAAIGTACQAAEQGQPDRARLANLEVKVTLLQAHNTALVGVNRDLREALEATWGKDRQV